MLRLSKYFLCGVWLALGLQSAFSFSPLGPINEPYQVPAIGYGLPGDLGAPKNLGEEYRRNTPVLFYSFEASFLDYFGSNGVAAVDAAFAILNNLTNVSQMSPDLSEFPLSVTRENFQAEALSLHDIKSFALSALAEQLALAPPERYIWTLHDRFHEGTPPCPTGMEYLVIQRNFDPVPSAPDQFQTSSYVNGTLYSYYIYEDCGAPPDPPDAVTVPFPVDPLDFAFTAVATERLSIGRFYTGLTRDDVGGLRYLLRTNNYNVESTGPNTLALLTNNTPQLLYTSNLTLLASQAITNDAAGLAALYPGLIASSTPYFVNVYTTNAIAYFTNSPWDPAGTPAHLEFTTDVTVSVGTFYSNTFANIFTVTNTSNGWIRVPVSGPFTSSSAAATLQTLTVDIAQVPWSPAGTTFVQTNITSTPVTITNVPVGDFFLLPAGACDIGILYPQLTNVIAITNVLLSATNAAASTNVVVLRLAFEQQLITYFTQRVFVVKPVTCSPANVALRQGIDRIQFVRRDYDSLLSRVFIPVTNQYVLNAVTNSTILPQVIQRTVAAPDFTFAAADLAAGPGARPGASIYARNLNFNEANSYPGLDGPGTVETSTTITWNKVGPIYLNLSPNAYFIDTAQASQTPMLIWGSFDGSTNLPVVYPNGTSIANIESQVLIQITATDLITHTAVPNGSFFGSLNVVFSAQFTAAGGQPPYLWSLAPGSAGLPPGFNPPQPNGTFLNGIISGTPTQAGIFDFTIRMTDAGGRTVERNCSITITP